MLNTCGLCLASNLIRSRWCPAVIPKAKPAVVQLFREGGGPSCPFTRAELEELAQGPMFDRYRRLKFLGCALVPIGIFLSPFLIALVPMTLWLAGLRTSRPAPLGLGLGLMCIATLSTAAYLLWRSRRFESKLDALLALVGEFENVGATANRRFSKLNTRKTRLKRVRTALALANAQRLTQIVKETEQQMSQIIRDAQEKHAHLRRDGIRRPPVGP